MKNEATRKVGGLAFKGRCVLWTRGAFYLRRVVVAVVCLLGVAGRGAGAQGTGVQAAPDAAGAQVWEFIVRGFENDAATLESALLGHIQTAMGEEDSSAIAVQASVFASEELVPDTAR